MRHAAMEKHGIDAALAVDVVTAAYEIHHLRNLTRPLHISPASASADSLLRRLRAPPSGRGVDAGTARFRFPYTRVPLSVMGDPSEEPRIGAAPYESTAASTSTATAASAFFMRALTARRFLTVGRGMSKVAYRYTAPLLQDFTALSLVVAAVAVPNMWGFVSFALAGVFSAVCTCFRLYLSLHESSFSPYHNFFTGLLLQPWQTASSFPSPLFVRLVILPSVRIFLAVSLCVQYSAVVGVVPSWLTSANAQWPFDEPGWLQFTLGLLPPSYASLLLPSFSALLFASLASRQLRVDQRAADAARPCLQIQPESSTQPASSPESSLLPAAPEPVGIESHAVVPARKASNASTLAAVDELLRPHESVLPSQEQQRRLSDWDAVQFFVCAWSEKVVLLLIFLLAASQVNGRGSQLREPTFHVKLNPCFSCADSAKLHFCWILVRRIGLASITRDAS
jgi:hypothetical protein